MKPIIKANNLSKQYSLGALRGASDTLRDALAGTFRARLNGLRRGRARRAADQTIWALRDISFEVMPGEVVGIIGHNGAGKSTLFKILSRVTEPTGGRAELYGRVSSLLEVGTGFHPELTGRENVFLNGSILGMGRGEIARKFDEIVAFAEIERFLDTPVKRYSSGMYMRLAFAVAAHLEPEILLVDEVLAVGDAAFQKKCLGKLGDAASEGRTVLFISHNMTAIQSMCKRVLWMSKGEIVEEADAGRVVSDYLKRGAALSTERVWNEMDSAPGNAKVRLRRTCVRPSGGSPLDDINIRTPLTFEFEFWNLEPGTRLSLSLHLYNEQGGVVFASVPLREAVWHGRPFPAGLFRSICRVPGDLLNDGVHRALLLVVRDESEVVFSFEDALIFDVLDSAERRGEWHGKWPGAVRPDLEWETRRLDAEAGPPHRNLA
jgi:lipopolysaccharide transport system ATP-binding protein